MAEAINPLTGKLKITEQGIIPARGGGASPMPMLPPQTPRKAGNRKRLLGIAGNLGFDYFTDMTDASGVETPPDDKRRGRR